MHNADVARGWPGFCLTLDVAAAAFAAMVMVVRAASGRKLQHLGASAVRDLPTVKGWTSIGRVTDGESSF
jgi:hypothetical protein